MNTSSQKTWNLQLAPPLNGISSSVGSTQAMDLLDPDRSNASHFLAAGRFKTCRKTPLGGVTGVTRVQLIFGPTDLSDFSRFFNVDFYIMNVYIGVPKFTVKLFNSFALLSSHKTTQLKPLGSLVFATAFALALAFALAFALGEAFGAALAFAAFAFALAFACFKAEKTWKNRRFYMFLCKSMQKVSCLKPACFSQLFLPTFGAGFFTGSSIS